ncbi:MAG: hypothetical protein K2X03_11105 [Bryobacteraceae bacterium]|nr:hypothetical protein [Bryobacteraceae bacterium]
MSRIIAILLVAMTELARAEDNGLTAWSNLQRLHAGQRIEVVDTKLKTHRGEFASAGTDDLTIQTASGSLVMSRGSVFRVSLREHSKRLRNTLLGAAIGGGAALAIGAIADRRFSNEGREHIAKTILTPIGLGVGAGIGAASAGFETIYRADPGMLRSGKARP